jgi:hypothetical protein
LSFATSAGAAPAGLLAPQSSIASGSREIDVFGVIVGFEPTGAVFGGGVVGTNTGPGSPLPGAVEAAPLEAAVEPATLDLG